MIKKILVGIFLSLCVQLSGMKTAQKTDSTDGIGLYINDYISKGLKSFNSAHKQKGVKNFDSAREQEELALFLVLLKFGSIDQIKNAFKNNMKQKNGNYAVQALIQAYQNKNSDETLALLNKHYSFQKSIITEAQGRLPQ